MLQQDLATLITALSGSLGQPDGTVEVTALQQTIAPLLGNDLQQTITNPVVVAAPVVTPPPVQTTGGKLNITSIFPTSNLLLTESPGVFKTIGNRPISTVIARDARGPAGAGILNHLPVTGPVRIPVKPINPPVLQQPPVKIPVEPPIKFPVQPPVKIPIGPPRPITITEIIEVFLPTDTTNPALILPVRVNEIIIITAKVTSYTVVAGSIWIRSNLLNSTAPAGAYTGLTISGGTISFSQPITLINKQIIMPAGVSASVSINLQQPVDNTVSPDNIGIDAMNAKVELPSQFSFNMTDSAISIVSVAQASWQLYGSANTFQYDPAQAPIYNAAMNGIYIGCKVTAPAFTVSNCGSTFFTVQGTSTIIDGYWELPVATINIAQANVATGAGSLAALCGVGLQVNWTGLKGGWVNLVFPLLSATVGAIAITDQFASNRYGTQHYDLWSNETTGRLSTLDVSYANLFTLTFLSIQDGEEILSTSVHFLANIDRPVRVDGSPVSVKGTNGLLYQAITPANKTFLLYDAALLAENYPPPINTPLTSVPQEAIALTNALMTVTPASAVLLYGQLDTPATFKQARLLISFGLYNLVPALPDPYASSRPGFNLQRGIGDIANGQIPTTLPLNQIRELLTGMVNWPQAGAAQGAPQLADVAFAIYPLAGNTTFSSNAVKAASPIKSRQTANIPPQQTWDQYTAAFAVPGFSLLDVSTNADLMGVSLSTSNIQVSSGDNVYNIQSVDNSAETDILQILGMDLSTPGKFIRAFTVPEISWEPLINLTPPVVAAQDPPEGWLLFGDDGGPTQIFNNSPTVVPIAPIPVSNFIVDTYTKSTTDASLITASLFTLPFGMRSMAVLMDSSKYPAGFNLPTLSIEPQNFDITPTGVPNAPKKVVSGGLQIAARGQQDTTQPDSSASFMGFTMQMDNLLKSDGTPANSSVLGAEVDFIFNSEFKPPMVRQPGVPVERIDFSGYGASMFSNWQDPTATIAATSQAKFDVIVGRTSLEIIQVKSLVYPWGIRVVRTITMYRSAAALVYRVDSGWRAETDGIYDFSFHDKINTPIGNPYQFHPGIVKGVFDVKNIIENDLPQFTVQWSRNSGKYIEPNSQIWMDVPGTGVTETVLLQPVYFDAEVKIDNVVQGGKNNMVPSKKMLGYVQLGPRGEPVSPQIFNQLLASQAGSLGGPVDCIVNIGGSGQQIRVTRVDVAGSTDPVQNIPVFTGTARGTVILPKDGSWSIVQHSQATDAVSAIDNNAAVPLIREGLLKGDLTSEYPDNQIRLANPIDLLKAPDATTINYGLLQNTGTQKVLYQLPAYLLGATNLLSKGNNFPLAKYADAFHLVNSTGIFPNLGDVPVMDMTNYAIQLKNEGYQLLNNLNPGKLLQQALPSPWYFVKTNDVKLYIEYNTTDQKGNAASNLNYDLDSVAEQWENSAKNITLNVDLGPFTKLVYINGDFDSSNGSDSAFNIPALQFGPDLKPVVDILQVLESLSTTNPDYASIAAQALQIAMSNSGDNFEYKFHADKEIATLQFPPAEADGPTTPLRLTAGLKVGAYFNEAISITSDPSNLIPSAGAYFEFDGGIQVMCVSLAAATIYAVGQVTVKISADIKTGPSLYMKFGFGVELMVGLPVVGNVSVTYMVGIEMTLTSANITITAFLLFKGEADLLGGLVDITITIEASGTVSRQLSTGPTDMTAQVTFAIDISIFLVINIDFSKSWSESRQIA